MTTELPFKPEQQHQTELLKALLKARNNFTGTDAAFARIYGINGSIYSRIKAGDYTVSIGAEKLAHIAQLLRFNKRGQHLLVVHTDVYKTIEKHISFCQAQMVNMIYADLPEIGKTTAMRDLLHRGKNRFYVECKTNPNKYRLIRAIAQAVGVENTGTYYEVFDRIVNALNSINKPLVMLDDAGYLDYKAFLQIIALQDATQGNAAWYTVGDDALKQKLDKMIDTHKVGAAAYFTRSGSNYHSIVPNDNDKRINFYTTLLMQILLGNNISQADAQRIAKQCLYNDMNVRNAQIRFSGARRIMPLINQYQHAA